MNASEAAMVLAVAATLDPRLKPPTSEDAQARAVMWSETLDKDMSLAEAQRLVTEHYADEVKGLMPANLNQRFRDRKRQQAEEKRREMQKREIEAMSHGGTPMPDEIRKKFNEILGARVG